MRLIHSFIMILSFPWMAFAHGPTPQKIDESVIIQAPVEQVWGKVKDFGKLADWNPAVSKSESTGGNAPGAKRVLILKNGETIQESLDTFDEAKHEYRYRLDKENLKALPVSSYSAGLKVETVDEGSKVTWFARAYRGDTGNEPPDHLNDEAAVKAMTEFFQTGLQRLKTTLEKRS